jgi:hypothetical protein
MRKWFLALVPVCALGLLGASGRCEPGKDPPAKDSAASSLEARRAKCRKLEPRTLKIAEPVEIKEATYWKDGGSLSLRLVDKKRVEHAFVIRRGASGPLDITQGAKGGEPRRVELGGPEEQELYGVLLRWADRHPMKAELLKRKGVDLGGATLQAVQGMLIRLDNRITIYLGGVVKD